MNLRPIKALCRNCNHMIAVEPTRNPSLDGQQKFTLVVHDRVGALGGVERCPGSFAPVGAWRS